jgi:hypothetical protein
MGIGGLDLEISSLRPACQARRDGQGHERPGNNWNVGIMEYWNNWFWDAGSMVYWENVPDKNIKKQETCFEKSSFHHSIIPCLG